jgi:hypothetical protein
MGVPQQRRYARLRAAGLCVGCGSRAARALRTHCVECAAKAATRRTDLREEIIKSYGGCCECCGETEQMFLDVDHVAGDGATHRREVGHPGVYRDIKRLGFPRDRFQLLCCNCNQGKRRNGGVCPHAAKQTMSQART